MKTEKFNKYYDTLLFIIVLATLLCWAYFQSQQSINPDNAYLTNAAIRMLNGENMSAGYYDVNPPLSFLIYLPPAIAVKYFSAPIYYAVFFYGLFAVLLTLSGLYYILKQSRIYSETEKLNFFSIFSIISTLSTMNFFAERDLLIALALVPLFILQQSITNKDPISKKIKYSILSLAPIFILLKPHYLIIPTLLILHRAIKNKDYNIFKSPDFISLVLTCLAYGIILLIFFNDFITIIFPDIITMYAMQTEALVIKAAFEYGFSIFLMILISCLLFDNPYHKGISLLLVSGVCLSIYTLMNKGFLYQLIPFFTFFSLATGLILQKVISEILGKIINTQVTENITVFLIYGLFLAGIIFGLSPKIPFLTHQEYKNEPVTRLIQDKCPEENCTFFMFNDRIDIMHELSVYSEKKLASRFPTFFFLPFIIPSNPSALPEPDRKKTSNKYTNMIADDFEKHSPKILLIGQFHLDSEETTFDFMSFLTRENPRFTQIFHNYKEEGTITIDQSKYTGKIFLTTKKIEYKIYIRK